MALGCGMSCVKYLIFCFNLLFAISGLIILIVGSWLHARFNHFVEWLDVGMVSSPIILIVVGVVIFIVAFFGCCGAVKENHCMIITFSLFLLVIFVVEVAVGVAGYVKHGELEQILNQRFNESIVNYPTRPDLQKAFNMLQFELECCGTEGPADWTKQGIAIPDSCCNGLDLVNGVPTTCQPDSPNIHNDGCMPKLLKILQDKALVLGGVTIGIASVQLMGVILACCLARSIRREYETV